MVSEEEKIKRLRWKLRLYGSYTREIEQLEHRLFDIQQEMAMNEFTAKAARNMGVPGDPYHPADKELQNEEASIPAIMKEAKQERSYLGLNDLIQNLSGLEKKIIMGVYTNEKTFADISKEDDVSYSQTSCFRTVEEILKRWNAFREK